MFWKTRDEDLFLGKTAKSVLKIGVDTKGRGIHLDPGTLLQHMLVAGSAKAERREFLLSMMEQAISAGAGGVFVDDHGDDEALSRIKAMVAANDPAKEVLVLDLLPAHWESGSNSFNPLEGATATGVASLVDDLCHDPYDTWTVACRRRLIPVLSAALCWLRDCDGRYIDLELVLETSKDTALADLAIRTELPELIRSAIGDYLAATTREERERLDLNLTQRIAPLFDLHGPVFNAKGSEVDLGRIVEDRAYLVVLLPSLEKSSDHASYPPLLLLSALKGMLSDRLHGCAEVKEGPVKNGISNPDNQFPFLCVFEEAPYYIPREIELMTAMARASGIAIVAGSSDTRAIVHRSFLANVLTKVFFNLQPWPYEFDEMLTQSRLGRDDVRRAFRGIRADNPFRSGRAYVQGQRQGEFVLANSGRVIVGRADVTGGR
jgi:hypothetical protein